MKVEFLSPAWFTLIHDLLTDAARDIDLGARQVTISEEFTDVPEHLSDGPSSSLAWHFRVSTGSVEVARGRAPDADLHTQATYATALAAARLVYTADNAEQVANSRAEAMRAGSFHRSGDEGALPPDLLAALVGVHNTLARRTR